MRSLLDISVEVQNRELWGLEIRREARARDVKLRFCMALGNIKRKDKVIYREHA